jgi:hypothetical protein
VAYIFLCFFSTITHRAGGGGGAEGNWGSMYLISLHYTVKKAVELLDVPSKNTFLM